MDSAMHYESNAMMPGEVADDEESTARPQVTLKEVKVGTRSNQEGTMKSTIETARRSQEAAMQANEEFLKMFQNQNAKSTIGFMSSGTSPPDDAPESAKKNTLWTLEVEATCVELWSRIKAINEVKRTVRLSDAGVASSANGAKRVEVLRARTNADGSQLVMRFTYDNPRAALAAQKQVPMLEGTLGLRFVVARVHGAIPQVPSREHLEELRRQYFEAQVARQTKVLEGLADTFELGV